MKLTRERKNKPLFWEYILYDPEAFKVVFFMSMIMGVIINFGLLGSAFYFDWYSEIKVILSIVAVFNVINFIKFLRHRNYMDISIGEMVFNKKTKVKKHGNDRKLVKKRN